MTPTPSPKQMQDAHKLSVMVYGEGLSGIEKRTAIFLAARDAAKDREIAELREEVRAFPGQIINITKTYESAFSSIKERAEQAEAALAAYRQGDAAADKMRNELAAMTRERDAAAGMAEAAKSQCDAKRDAALIKPWKDALRLAKDVAWKGLGQISRSDLEEMNTVVLPLLVLAPSFERKEESK